MKIQELLTTQQLRSLQNVKSSENLGKKVCPNIPTNIIAYIYANMQEKKAISEYVWRDLAHTYAESDIIVAYRDPNGGISFIPVPKGNRAVLHHVKTMLQKKRNIHLISGDVCRPINTETWESVVNVLIPKQYRCEEYVEASGREIRAYHRKEARNKMFTEMQKCNIYHKAKHRAFYVAQSEMRCDNRGSEEHAENLAIQWYNYKHHSK